MEFSKKLKILAGKHRYSQSMLARELGVSQNLVSLWTRGVSIPDLYEAARIARLFNVDVNYLADDSLDDVPAVALTEEERAVVAILRAKGLTLDDAVKRLDTDPSKARQPEPSTHKPGPAYIGPSRDETEAALRQQREIDAAKRKIREERPGPVKNGGAGRSGGKSEKSR